MKSHGLDENPKAFPVNSLFWMLVIGLAFIAIILIAIGLVDLSSKESSLLGTLLTLMSISIGWGVSHYYATIDKERAIQEVREFEQRNLRTYALKAAEKVTNLSKELNRLSSYLEEELQYTAYKNSEDELFAKEERIESAIHILGSLRSINDTSLSDWQGVIGDELDEQRHTEEIRSETLRELTDRLDVIERTAFLSANNSEPIYEKEIQALKREFRSLARDMDRVSFSQKLRPAYQNEILECPVCGEAVHIKMRKKDASSKATQCKSCKANLIAEYFDVSGTSLRVRKEVRTFVECPNCKVVESVDLDEWPTASLTKDCESCGIAIKISRIDAGRSLRVIQAPPQQQPAEPLTPELLSKIQGALPNQPWPKGIHQSIALSLEIRPQTVQKAIKHLIRSGVFMDQVDGVLCTPAEKLELMRSVGRDLQ